MGDTRALTAGYSMLELLVVLAIVSMLAVMALPASLRAIDRMTLSSDTRLVASAIMRLREHAADQQTDILVTTLPTRPGVLDASDGTSITLSSGTNARVTSENNAEPAMTISWDGSVSGTIQLTRNTQVTTVSAEHLTGRVKVGSTQ